MIDAPEVPPEEWESVPRPQKNALLLARWEIEVRQHDGWRGILQYVYRMRRVYGDQTGATIAECTSVPYLWRQLIREVNARGKP